MRRTLLSVAALGLLLAACGGDDAGSPAPAGSAAPGATAADATDSGTPETAPGDTGPGGAAPDTTAAGTSAAVPEVLQFSAVKVGGGEIDFSQYAGRTVALWFWAPT